MAWATTGTTVTTEKGFKHDDVPQDAGRPYHSTVSSVSSLSSLSSLVSNSVVVTRGGRRGRGVVGVVVGVVVVVHLCSAVADLEYICKRFVSLPDRAPITESNHKCLGLAANVVTDRGSSPGRDVPVTTSDNQ